MNDKELEALIQKVQANQKYQSITKDLVARLSKSALAKGLRGKAAVKDVRNKLHQIGSAYFKRRVDYDSIQEDLSQLPKNLQSKEVQQFSIRHMGSHVSTAERTPILENFFSTCLESISPVNSVLDLACGLNPLAIPWMPLQLGFTYHACDIYMDMLGMIQSFFDHFDLNGTSSACDLIGKISAVSADVAFLLKSIPCLEQVDKDIGLVLLEDIPTKHILVSFPVQSIGGQDKGMPDFYQDHFYEMITGKSWHIRRYAFETELAFLVTK